MLDVSKIYYTYKLIRPWNNVPAYIGKGKEGRAEDHEKICLNEEKEHDNPHLKNVFLRAQRLGLKVIIEYVKENLTEEEAYALEIQLIAEIGRQDMGLGPLCNMTDGGDGVRDSSGKIREKLRIAQLGKKLSEETKSKIGRKGELHGMYGKTHTLETKAHWSRKRKGVVLTEKHKNGISEGVKKNWEKRRHYPLSDETRRKRSENALRQWAERRAKKLAEKEELELIS